MAEAPVRRRPVSQHWSVRLRDLVSTYVPLLLMLLLAGATWWLVRVTPVPSAPRAVEPSPQAPDYTLMGVDLQRYAADGALLARIRGQQLRHFPQGDRLELTEAHIRLRLQDAWIDARSPQAVLTEGGDRAHLFGGVVLIREATATQAGFELRTEAVQVEVPQGLVSSSAPTVWLQAGSRVQAAGFTWRREADTVDLVGPVRANLLPIGPGRR